MPLLLVTTALNHTCMTMTLIVHVRSSKGAVRMVYLQLNKKIPAPLHLRVWKIVHIAPFRIVFTLTHKPMLRGTFALLR